MSSGNTISGHIGVCSTLCSVLATTARFETIGAAAKTKIRAKNSPPISPTTAGAAMDTTIGDSIMSNIVRPTGREGIAVFGAFRPSLSSTTATAVRITKIFITFCAIYRDFAVLASLAGRSATPKPRSTTFRGSAAIERAITTANASLNVIAKNRARF